MYKLLSFALLFGFSTASLPKGVVDPVIVCGGVGEPLELRVPDCTTPPCILVPGRSYTVEGDFIPSADCPLLGFKLYILHNDSIHFLLDAPIPGSQVIGGNPYTVSYPLTPGSELRGEAFSVLIQVYCTENEIVEICVGAPCFLE